MNVSSVPPDDECPVPAEVLDRWRRLISAVTDTMGVAAGLVTRALPADRIVMQVVSDGPLNPYRTGHVDDLVEGMYCERVLQGRGELAVVDATAGGRPSTNPDVALGLRAYLGYPVEWPDGTAFGTICVLDRAPQAFGPDSRLMLSLAREAIEADLATIGNGDAPRPARPARGSEGTDALSWDFEIGSGTVRLSRKATQWFGLTLVHSVLPVRHFLDLFHPASRAQLTRMLTEPESDQGRVRQWSALVSSGAQRSKVVVLHSRGLHDATGTLRWVIGTVSEVGRDRWQGERPLPERSLSQPRIVVDERGEVILVTADAAGLIGAPVAEILGRPLVEVLTGPATAAIWPSVRAALDEDVGEQLFLWRRFEQGGDLFVKICSLRSADGIGGVELTLLEPREIRSDQEVFRAPEPRGTVPDDRAQVETTLDRMRIDHALTGRPHSLIVLEVHDLEVRAALDGSDYVDWVVDTVVGTARTLSGGCCTAGLRFGTVAVAAWGIDTTEAVELARRIVSRSHGATAAVGPPVQVSAGVLPVESFTEPSDVLIRQARATSETAVEADPPVQVYTPAAVGDGSPYHRAAVAKEVRTALDEARLSLHCQPIIDITAVDPELHGYETLVRMTDHDGNVVAAGDFVEAAEQFGLIGEVDRFVLHRALVQQSVIPAPLRLNINLSASSLADLDLWSVVGDEIERAGADPSRLTFEITETALMTRVTAASAFVQQARRAGCRIALDDFGTGMSSFSYLAEFGVDYLKIDKSFVAGCAQDGPVRLLVHSMSTIAHQLGAQSVAEGVDSAEVLEVVADLGVDLVQGYFLGRPAPYRPADG